MTSKQFLLIGAVALSSVVGQKAHATLYTIPGTSVQIDISSSSSDPQYQLTSDEITQLLTALAQYPASQLEGLKYVQAQPYGSDPGAPSAVSSTTSDGGIILYLQSLASRQVTPYNFNGTLPGDVSLIAYGELSPQQMQEWSAIPLNQEQASIFEFIQYFTLWQFNSFTFLNTALLSADPGQILSALFMAGVFTNWLTNQVFYYSSPTAPPDELVVTLTSTELSFGSAYQFFLQNGQVVGYQIGTGSRVNLSTPLTLPSTLADYLPITQKFTRAGTNVDIQIVQTGGPPGQFTPEEMQGLLSILNTLPASQLVDIGQIQSEPDPPSQSVSALQGDWTVTGNVVTFNLGNYAQRLVTPTPVDAEFSRAVGFYLYGNVLTSSQINAYDSYLPVGRAGLSSPTQDQYDFADDYANWIMAPPFGTFFNPRTSIGHRPSPPIQSLDTGLLAKDLFMASFFINSANATISFYSQGPGLTHTVQAEPIIRTANILILGSYVFELSGNMITGIINSAGTLVKFAQPFAIPPSLLAVLPPVASTAASTDLPSVETSAAPEIVSPALEAISPTIQIQSPPGAALSENPAVYMPVISQEGQRRLQDTFKRLSKKGISGMDLLNTSVQDSPHPVTLSN